MPRDDWAKARARDVARKAERKNERSSLRSIQRHKAHRKQKIATSRLQSWKTVLWFGKHKGKTISEVNASDPSYLDFLARTADSKQQQGWRMDALVQFLAKIRHNRHSPRKPGQPAPAAVQRGDEAPVTSIEGRGKSVARIGTSAENNVDFSEVFATIRCESD